MIRKTFKYRLYPTRAQAELLNGQLAEACRLYNAALQERRDAWRLNRKSVSFKEQCLQLTEIRAAGDIALPNAQCAQNVLRRVDEAFQGFFRRVRGGRRAGFPRFKTAGRYDSLTFPKHGNGCRLTEAGKLHIQGVGAVKLKLHRPVAGRIKTVTVLTDAGRWYVCFSAECDERPLTPRAEAVGVDLGLTYFVTLSDGTTVENPRHAEKAGARIRCAARKISRRKKGSNRRRKAVTALRRVHARARHQRADFHHKVARELVNGFGLIAVEKLNFEGLVKGVLARPVRDAGWSSFIKKLAEKAGEAARKLVMVDPRGTSQTCVCGADVPKTLSHRWHLCQACGLSAPRDVVSAQVILGRGLRLQDLTCPAAECVS